MNNHLLTYWPFGVESKGFDELVEHMQFKRCTFLYEAEKEVVEKEGYTWVNIYNGLNFFLKSDVKSLPLDKDVIELLRPYEMTAMGIINRWRRSVTSTEGFSEIKRLYYAYVAYWWNYIKVNKVTHLFLGAVPHITLTYIPYMICKAIDIPVIYMEPMAAFDGYRQNHLLKESIEIIDWQFETKYEQNMLDFKESKYVSLSSEMEQYFEQYAQDNNAIKRIIVDTGKKSISDKIELIKNRIKIYIERNDYKILYNKMMYSISVKRKSKRIMKIEEKLSIEPNLTCRYIFFPLHYQPEATTMPGAGVYESQLLVVKILAHCLPEGVYLYVKEHPAYWKMKSRREGVFEARSKSFYEEIVALNNVKLIRHDYNSLDLMDKCEALITETGTAGLECLFKNRPVIVFGNARYKYYKYTNAVNGIEDCKKILDQILRQPQKQISDSENLRELRIYAKTLEPNVVSFEWNYINYIENGLNDTIEKDVLNLAQKVERRFNEYCEQ